MAYGLQVWDASGNLVLDTNDRVFTIVGSFTRTFSGETTDQSGSFSAPDIARGTPGYIVVDWPLNTATGDVDWRSAVTVSFSGTTVSWTVDALAVGYLTETFTFYYGYY